jgi:hypothetical protein
MARRKAIPKQSGIEIRYRLTDAGAAILEQREREHNASSRATAGNTHAASSNARRTVAAGI